MKLVTFSTGTERRVGVVDAERGVVRDVTAILPPDMGVLGLIEGWAEHRPVLEHAAAAQPELPLESVRLLAPIPAPRRNVFCVGKNYRDHVVEWSGRAPDRAPGRSWWSSSELPLPTMIAVRRTPRPRAGPYRAVRNDHPRPGLPPVQALYPALHLLPCTRILRTLHLFRTAARLVRSSWIAPM